MLKKLVASATAVLALAAVVALPSLAGGDHCGGAAARTTAWAGAWLQRSAAGAVTVAEVAGGSPAARAGLRKGDIVTAVNGWSLAGGKDRATCSAGAECSVGSAVTYTVQRGNATKSIKVKLEKMPADAASRFANRDASFDPALAAMVMPAVD